MGNIFSWFLRVGIVRVLSVPIGMGLLVYVMYLLAAPPPWTDDDEGERRAS